MKRKNLYDTDTLTEKQWLSETIIWFKIGCDIEKTGELIIASEAYSKFHEEIKRKSISGKDFSKVLSLDQALKLSKFFTLFPDKHLDAIKYAEIGLQIDHFNKEIRDLITLLSPSHKAQLEKEARAVNSIISLWKNRCWSNGFRKRLKKNVILELEDNLKNDYFNLNIRSKLEYYAREKYRYIFLFENICAQRIQGFLKQRKKFSVWQEAQRRHYNGMATDLYHRFMKDSLNLSLRNEILKISKHRLINRKHLIHIIQRQILKEMISIACIEKCFKAFKLKRIILLKIRERRERFLLANIGLILKIQNRIRIKLAKCRINEIRKEYNKKYLAALIIQKFWRKILGSIKFLAYHMLQREIYDKRRSMYTLRKRLTPILKRVINYKRRYRFLEEKRKLELIEKKRLLKSGQIQVFSINVIKHFYIYYTSRFWYKRAVKCLRENKTSAQFYFQPLINTLQKHIYENPLNLKVDQNSKAYFFIQNRKALYIQGNLITLNEYLTLGDLLQDRKTKLTQLVFHNITHFSESNINQDLQSNISIFIRLNHSLINAHSVRSIFIIEGSWSLQALFLIFKLVQIENPRINELHFEAIDFVRKNGISFISICSSNLLKDFFNYTLPGIQELSLVNCGLNDNDIFCLAEGLKVNTSLKSLVLANNYISDLGAIFLIKDLFSNKKSILNLLDLQQNFITNRNNGINNLISCYLPPTKSSFLEIILTKNYIFKYFDILEINPKFRYIFVQHLSIVYDHHKIITDDKRALENRKKK